MQDNRESQENQPPPPPPLPPLQQPLPRLRQNRIRIPPVPNPPGHIHYPNLIVPPQLQVRSFPWFYFRSFESNGPYLSRYSPGQHLLSLKAPISNDPIEVSSVTCQQYFHHMNKTHHFEKNNLVMISLYHHTPTAIQNGPTCGLVALEMCLRQLGFDVDINILLKSAKDSGFTKYGEMFSVENLAKVAMNLYPVEAEIKRNLLGHTMEVLDHLSHGFSVCIPYDTDNNHEPARKRGHRAHWAAILGYLIVVRQSDAMNIAGKMDKDFKYLKHLDRKNKELPKSLLELINKKQHKQIYVYARQGTSRLLHIWKLEELCLSNNNLTELSPYYSAQNFVIPENDMIQGLCHQFLFIKPILLQNQYGECCIR